MDIVAHLDLSQLYAHYKSIGGAPIAPEVLLALLFYGYATGRFSSRKIEKATYADLGYRYVAGGYIPIMRRSPCFAKPF